VVKTVYLGLGSNIGSRRNNINCALAFLQAKLAIIKTSSIYETSAVGGVKQRNFFNCAVKAKTKLSPYELLKFVKGIEGAMGRAKTVKWGPRLIDIDILFYSDKVIKGSNTLTLPHKEVLNRLFVLTPLNDIAANFTHPVIRQKIKTLYNNALLTLPRQKVKIIA